MHLLPHKIKVLKIFPLKWQLQEASFTLKKIHRRRSCPLSLWVMRCRWGCIKQREERDGERNGEVMRRKEEEIMWVHGRQQFFFHWKKRNNFYDGSEIPNVSLFPFCPSVLAPLALVPFFQLSIFYFAIKRKKWLVSTVSLSGKLQKCHCVHLHLPLVRWLGVREKKDRQGWF